MREIVTYLINDLEYDKDILDLIILPGMLHINLAKARVVDHVMIGAQDVSSVPGGAYCGEVSA